MASLYEQQQQHNIMIASINEQTLQSTNINNNNMITTTTSMAYAEAFPSSNQQQYIDASSNYISGPIMMKNSNHRQQQQMMVEGCGGISLSEASVCSSMGIRTPDIHPVPDVALPVVTQVASYGVGELMYAQQQNYELPYALHDPVVVWPNTNNTDTMFSSSLSTADSSAIPSRSSSIVSIKSEMIEQQQQQQAYQTTSSSSIIESSPSSTFSSDEILVQFDSSTNNNENQMIMQQQEEPYHYQHEIASMRKSPIHRRNTVSLPVWCDNEKDLNIRQEEEAAISAMTEKEIRRQSMNDLVPNNFRHLSREQLIERVVQLEKEKQLTSNKLLSSEESTTRLLDNSNNNSDEEDCLHTCLWAGCDTSVASLDQLITHIKDVHIGSGKAAYYCEWANCPREQKPFLKRHKMQNHMRTHTGERPFECNVEGCDKKFSRPDSLNTHIKTHSNIRPYACPIENCGKAYFHSRSLRKHAKSHESSSSCSLTEAVVTDNGNNKKNHPYDRSLKPSSKYHQQQQCGTESRQTSSIITPTTTNTSNYFITPTPPPIIIQQEHQQQQQIFAAGPAYVYHQQQLPYYYTQHSYAVSNNTFPSSYANTYNGHQYIY